MVKIEEVPSETAVVPFVAGKAHVLSYPRALAIAHAFRWSFWEDFVI